MAGAGLFWKKSTASWLRLVAGGWFVLREKYSWLVADKPSEQAGMFNYHKLKRERESCYILSSSVVTPLVL
jgi:hypothetical protein